MHFALDLIWTRQVSKLVLKARPKICRTNVHYTHVYTAATRMLAMLALVVPQTVTHVCGPCTVLCCSCCDHSFRHCSDHAHQ
jgi:hypothetical protein